ncbi:MAG: DNA-processing protein DprA [Candidatus Sumerlaeia bacterium]|nr:DNA-processing protein DprA [Candidatus Sumerlaeia bacterium]
MNGLPFPGPGLPASAERLLHAACDEAGLRGPLYWHGNPAVLDAPRVALVGTREPIAWTLSAMEGLAGILAQLGATIVSGGAIGTDSAAHRGALHTGGRTVVVLPCPIEDIDLRRWRPALAGLWDLERVLFLSPFRSGTRPRRGHPIVRNRLVAALSDAAVIGQTGLQGGTNHLLACATTRGMPVFFLDAGVEDTALAQALRTLEAGGAVRFDERMALEGRPLGAGILRAAANFRQRRQRDDDAQLRWCEPPEDYRPGV